VVGDNAAPGKTALIGGPAAGAVGRHIDTAIGRDSSTRNRFGHFLLPQNPAGFSLTYA
jgi:hypothetical protein